MKICISLCTKNRPKMLGQCLESLVPAIALAGVEAFVVVVENSASPDSRAVVDRFAGRLDIHYFLEPEPGIPFARNRGIEEALKLGFDWLIFIDDDEFVAEDWLKELAAAPARFDAEVFSGPRIRVYPPETPAWFPHWLDEIKLSTGTGRNVTYTANTMAAARLFRTDGLNLRFDGRFRHTGGSDTEMFRRFTGLGGKIIWIAEARLSEDVPLSRLSLKWNAERRVRITNNWAFIARYHGGTGLLLRYVLPQAARIALDTLGHLGYGIFRLPFNRNSGREHLFLCVLGCSGIFGYILGLLGVEVNPYRKIEGG